MKRLLNGLFPWPSDRHPGHALQRRVQEVDACLVPARQNRLACSETTLSEQTDFVSRLSRPGWFVVACIVVWPVVAWSDEPPMKLETITNSIGMELVRVPPGEFLRGAPAEEFDSSDDERPRQPMRITRPFYMGVYEVTQSEYREVMGENPSFFSPEGRGKELVEDLETGRFPADQVSWTNAVEFCRRLSDRPDEKEVGRIYRLPTEAEWEYACRAGTESPFSFGDSLGSQQANFNAKHPYGDAEPGQFLARTTTVGSYQPNAFGLYDMHGNVWEWCLDRYDPDFYRESPRDDPIGPRTGLMRSIRGGGWYSDGRDCRSAFRYAELPDARFYVMGFRVVMTTAPTLPLDELYAETTAPRSEPAAKLSPEARLELAEAGGEEWPRWRGPRGDGTWHGPPLPETWPDSGLKQHWRQPIGGGYSGIAAAGGRVYTMDYRSDPREVERVLCFDGAAGRLLWSFQYDVDYEDLSYGNGPRCTPTVHEGRVYTLGTMGDAHCLDAATGELHWSRNFAGEERENIPTWGLAASPVIWEQSVILHVGNQPGGSLVALDRRTGEELWRSLDDPAGYATPILIEHQGSPQLVAWTPANIHGVDPRTGKRLWTVPFEVTYGTAIHTPVFHQGLVIVCNYWEGSKAIRPPRDGEDRAEVVWEDSRNLRGLMSQPLCQDGYVWLLDKRHGLTCFEAETGRKLWDDDNRMTPKGRNPQATMVRLADSERVLVLNSDGELILARFTPQGYEEQSRTSVIDGTWAHPAYAWGRAYVRNDRQLVCISLHEPGE
jgi:outer membrane protein assembly factor BamB